MTAQRERAATRRGLGARHRQPNGPTVLAAAASACKPGVACKQTRASSTLRRRARGSPRGLRRGPGAELGQPFPCATLRATRGLELTAASAFRELSPCLVLQCLPGELKRHCKEEEHLSYCLGAFRPPPRPGEGLGPGPRGLEPPATPGPLGGSGPRDPEPPGSRGLAAPWPRSPQEPPGPRAHGGPRPETPHDNSWT